MWYRPEKLSDVWLAEVMLLDIPLPEVPQPLDPEPMDPEVAEPVPEQESSWRMMSSMSLDVELASLLLVSSCELLCRNTKVDVTSLKSSFTALLQALDAAINVLYSPYFKIFFFFCYLPFCLICIILLNVNIFSFLKRKWCWYRKCVDVRSAGWLNWWGQIIANEQVVQYMCNTHSFSFSKSFWSCFISLLFFKGDTLSCNLLGKSFFRHWQILHQFLCRIWQFLE